VANQLAVSEWGCMELKSDIHTEFPHSVTYAQIEAVPRSGGVIGLSWNKQDKNLTK